jgi:hypothetical protein
VSISLPVVPLARTCSTRRMPWKSSRLSFASTDQFSPNRVSAALTLRWDRAGVLLAGDLVNEGRFNNRGWFEACNHIDHEIQVVNAAHHASAEAHHHPLWQTTQATACDRYPVQSGQANGKQPPTAGDDRSARGRCHHCHHEPADVVCAQDSEAHRSLAIRHFVMASALQDLRIERTPSPSRSTAMAPFAAWSSLAKQTSTASPRPDHANGTHPSTSATHEPTRASLGMRQSPRGDKATVPTFGPSAVHDRLN